MTDNTKILERIAALLTLAENNTNENEAAAAMNAASRLMAQHSIDRAAVDVHASSDPELEDVAIGDTILDGALGSQVPSWRWALASGIAAAHACSCYLSTAFDYATSKRRSRIMILGTGTDASAVRYLYTFAARQIEALCVAALRDNGHPGKSWGTNFRAGAAARVVSRYREATKRNVAEVRATASSTALVRVDDVADVKALALRAAEKAKNLRSTGGGRGGNFDSHARDAGRAAGDRVNLGNGSTRGALGAPSARLGSK